MTDYSDYVDLGGEEFDSQFKYTKYVALNPNDESLSEVCFESAILLEDNHVTAQLKKTKYQSSIQSMIILIT